MEKKYTDTFRLILSDAIQESIRAEREILKLKRVIACLCAVIVILVAGYFVI